MKIDKYLEILKNEYDAKVIDMKTEIRNYFSTPDMYGDKYDDVSYVSETHIVSDLFKTVVIEGKKIDPLGHYEWGMKADIVFIEYNDNKEVIRTCRISSYRCMNSAAEDKFYKILSCYKEK